MFVVGPKYPEYIPNFLKSHQNSVPKQYLLYFHAKKNYKKYWAKRYQNRMCLGLFMINKVEDLAFKIKIGTRHYNSAINLIEYTHH